MAPKFHDRERLFPPRLINYDNCFSANRNINQYEPSANLVSNGFDSSGPSFSNLSSPFGWEISSNEKESEDSDNEFVAEMARKMADNMLEEDDEDPLNGPTEQHRSEKLQKALRRRPTSVPEQHTFPAFSDNQPRAVDFFNLETQPPAEHRWRRITEGTDLTLQLAEMHQFHHQKLHMPYTGGRGVDYVGGVDSGSPATASLPLLQDRQIQKQQLVGSGFGSGESSVFLGRTGSKTGSSGTGVFLPGGIRKPTTISECSPIFIPARVIRVLQSMDFTSRPSQHKIGEALDLAVDHHEMVLPQEWTY